MKKILVKAFPILVAMVLSSFYAAGQEKQPYRAAHNFELAASGANGRVSGALSWSHVGKID
jgi:hypothetical protein